MMVKIVCPKCGVEGTLYLVKANYKGPYRCWKCHELFTLRIWHREVKSCEPLSQAEHEQQQTLETKRPRSKPD